MAHADVDTDVLNSVDSESTNPIPVIYQSGYLTIKDYDEEFGLYRLGFPNKEVEEGFIKYLIPFYLQKKGFSRITSYPDTHPDQSDRHPRAMMDELEGRLDG